VQLNADRRERLRKLALETVDLNKDPYFMRNHLGKSPLHRMYCENMILGETDLDIGSIRARLAGSYECKLCLTIHTNEGNYLAHTQVIITYQHQHLVEVFMVVWRFTHSPPCILTFHIFLHNTCSISPCWSGVVMLLSHRPRVLILLCALQGKRHQTNIARRAARDAFEAQQAASAPQAQTKAVRKSARIGRPGYRCANRLVIMQTNAFFPMPVWPRRFLVLTMQHCMLRSACLSFYLLSACIHFCTTVSTVVPQAEHILAYMYAYIPTRRVTE
jgi:hypothetical protein